MNYLTQEDKVEVRKCCTGVRAYTSARLLQPDSMVGLVCSPPPCRLRVGPDRRHAPPPPPGRFCDACLSGRDARLVSATDALTPPVGPSIPRPQTHETVHGQGGLFARAYLLVSATLFAPSRLSRTENHTGTPCCPLESVISPRFVASEDLANAAALHKACFLFK